MVDINWYPGHMVKTKKKIKENLKYIDVVVELIDARIPYSSKINEFNEMFKNKKKILVLTKYDLCDKKETEKWIKHYEEKNYRVISLDLIKGDVKKFFEIIENVMEETVSKREDKGMLKKRTRSIIVGVPNVGKSTLINRLVGKKATRVGNKPGVTTSLDWIRISDKLELLDTPGVLWPKLTEEKVALNLASFSAIKESVLPLDDVATYILETLKTYYPNLLKNRYGLDIIPDDIVELYDEIGKKRGCLIKGGEIDYDKVVNIVVNDLKSGLISNITFDRKDD